MRCSESQDPADPSPMLQMQGICKRYGAVRANENINFSVTRGQIVGLLGENGSGKSTLMKILFGMVRPDGGIIRFKGQALSGHTPRDAIRAGIAMIHQHFMLVDAMTVAENVMLGWKKAGAWLHDRQVAEQIRSTSQEYGLDLDPDAMVGDLPFGKRQRLEIVKALLRGAELLVLDEPTSNLSPPEVTALLAVMRRIAGDNRSIIFITHKLAEVFRVCQEVTVLRDGKNAGRCSTEGTTRAELARMMVGREFGLATPRVEMGSGAEVLEVTTITLKDSSGLKLLDEITFSVREGEILALAGVDGNGQTELVEVLAGLQAASSGRIALHGRDLTKTGVTQRLRAGLAYIPVDRATTSLVPGMTIAENLGLRDFAEPPLRRGLRLNHPAFYSRAVSRISEFGIRADGPGATVDTLSGGNQQKIVVAREIGRKPRVLIAFQATWGLDPGATRFVIDQILALRNSGGAVLYLSSDLEELLGIGDRIGVIANGRLVGIVPREKANPAEIGLLMAGGGLLPAALEINEDLG
ncbi:MAG: ABC transporter ATP-binding protein [Verrucomicrobia bacterium]|nr:ABC transporter ATP-binding protein [Verrucomicrobiota bacterium]